MRRLPIRGRRSVDRGRAGLVLSSEITFLGCRPLNNLSTTWGQIFNLDKSSSGKKKKRGSLCCEFAYVVSFYLSSLASLFKNCISFFIFFIFGSYTSGLIRCLYFVVYFHLIYCMISYRHIYLYPNQWYTNGMTSFRKLYVFLLIFIS